jgi:hypothetical protein
MWESGKGASLEPIKTTAKTLILFSYSLADYTEKYGFA